jgi:DNA polymerase III subunit epsilon
MRAMAATDIIRNGYVKMKIKYGIPKMSKLVDVKKTIESLEETGEYKVLHRLHPSSVYCEPDGTSTKLAIFLDLETTGLDHEADEIIELAMLPFRYSVDGRIFEVLEPLNMLQEPNAGTIPEEIVRITGITDEMVRGQKIDEAQVTEFVESAAIVIAHNAGFDRKFAEKQFPIFKEKPWACSMIQIPWKEEGFGGVGVECLGLASGFFFSGHRAVIDCQACIELLSKKLPNSRQLALKPLLENARKSVCRIWAENSRYETKDKLKLRGYRWNDGQNGRPKSWYTDVDEGQVEIEIKFLEKEIFGREIDLNIEKISAYDLFSNRA